MRFFKLCLFLTTFLFLTGFVTLPAVLGPAITAATSGNLVKASAQLIIDNEFKKKTGKSSLGYITEEVSKNNQQNRINKDFKDLIKKRVKISIRIIIWFLELLILLRFHLIKGSLDVNIFLRLIII